MSVRNGLALLFALFTLTFLVACGSSSSTKINPAGFGVGSLNGNYVFSSSGVDASGFFLTMVGSLAANGKGGLSGGTVDIIGQEVTPPSPVATSITGGSYHVGSDGRGQLSFNTTTLINGVSAAITVTLDFVLTSTSHGLVTEYDGNGTGSGTIDLQTAVTQSQVAGSYAFGLSGSGSGGAPLLTVGSVTLNSSGGVTAGLQDINNDTTAASGSITTSSFVNLTSTPGTATIANSLGPSFNFDVYPIDSTHVKLIETDGAAFLSGDAYTQGTSIPSGQLVYTMAGEDFSITAPLAVGGWLTNTGGAIAGLEDSNDGGTPALGLTVGSGSNFSSLSGGRSVLTLNGFLNGANGVAGNYTFAAYPFTFSGGSGIQLLEIDNGGITSGAAYPQSATTLASSQNFGLNLQGFNSNGEEDDIAQFVTTANGFSGAADLNDDDQLNGVTSQTFDQPLTTSSFTAPDGNGRGAAVTDFFGFNFYVVDSSTYILLETDGSQVGLGTFEAQTSPTAGAAAAHRAVSMMRPMVRPHAGRQKKN